MLAMSNIAPSNIELGIPVKSYGLRNPLRAF